MWVLEAAKAVDVPSVSIVVVATAKKTKIDILAVVFMLTLTKIFVIRDWFNLIITKSVAILTSIFDE